MSDLIDRKAAIKAVHDSYDNILEFVSTGKTVADSVEDILSKLLPVEPEPDWRPFKTRPLTKEEKEAHPEWDCVLDCKAPQDGQRILITVNCEGHEPVQADEYYQDCESYLDSGYEIETEATAWMPLPEPYKGGVK